MPEVFVELWPKIQEIYPDMKFKFITFENTPENAREILANMGQNIDVIAGVFDETMLKLRGWSYYSDLLRDDMIENHPEINIVDFDLYNVEAFNRCENNNEVLLAFKSWERRHMNGLAWQCLCFFWHTIY